MRRLSVAALLAVVLSTQLLAFASLSAHWTVPSRWRNNPIPAPMTYQISKYNGGGDLNTGHRPGGRQWNITIDGPNAHKCTWLLSVWDAKSGQALSRFESLDPEDDPIPQVWFSWAGDCVGDFVATITPIQVN